MKYEDLDKTQDLFDIQQTEVPSPIENIQMEGASKDNLTQELNLQSLSKEEESPEKTETKEEKKAKKERKFLKKLKEKWASLPKKKKIIIIIIGVLILLLIIGLIIFLVVKNKNNKLEEEPEVPTVIVENDNYIYKDGILIFLDENDNEIGTYECNNKDEKLCYVANYSTEDTFDSSKNVYEDGSVIPTRSVIYLNKYVFVYDNDQEEEGVISLYNIEETKDEGTYTLVKGFSDSNSVILKDEEGLYGALEFSEDGIIENIDFSLEYLGQITKDSKYVAKTNNKYFIYSQNGTSESKGISSPIKSYNNKYITVDDDGYLVYDYKGNKITDKTYDYISLLDNYMILIDSKKLYIRDYQNNKYNEEAITLSNTDYNPTYVYNEDKTLKETKKAFEVNFVENTLEVIYTKNEEEKSITINTLEGNLNKNYAYLNYFDGKLYFYNDEDKENLIGTYTCTNKNTVSSTTKALNNCLIATDSFYSKNEVEQDMSAKVGWIPIFNERYVFILDTIDKSHSSIVLYDLKNSKTLSKYETVDTSSYTSVQEITFKNTDNTLVMAKNTSGKYGMIKISSADVTKAIAFNYTSLEKLKEYYLAQESSGTYLLLNSSGEEITQKYGYKIVDYQGKYVKVVDGQTYYVGDFEGNKIDDTGYLYIALYDSYYAVITTNKKLDIHEYTNSDFKLSSQIDIGTTNDYANAFEITKTNAGYTIKIKSTGKTITADSTGLIPTDE